MEPEWKTHILLFKPPPIEDLEEVMNERFNNLESCDLNDWTFLNAIALVHCPEPTAEFFAHCRKLQGRWCRRVKRVLGPACRRSAKFWTSHKYERNKFKRLQLRQLCFTGLMRHNQKSIPHHEWKEVEMAAKNQAKVLA